MGWLRRKHAGERAEQEKQTHRGGPVPLSPPGLGEGAFTAALPDRGCCPGDVLQVPFRHPDAAAGAAWGAHGLVGAWTNRRSQLHVTWRHSQRKSLSRGSITGGRGRPHWLASCRGWPVADAQCERAREAGERCAHGCPRWAASAAVCGPGAPPVGTPLWASQGERVKERPPRAPSLCAESGSGALAEARGAVGGGPLGAPGPACPSPGHTPCSSLRCPIQLLSRQGVAPASLF